ncbi:zeta toxin family protein [Cytophagaceae bacterium DM2B3-1]|uniref:Zeta toxin family protein n=1 Tax=Xanthocytophaga flava TaxID=3048013 RepID=A0ABT7CYD8_9BACT|nr:zeta toxin family protein [Xanthocytophaga flavus]MDJ1498795.1 zeta toxin family protein [Xanthocytophaga flavus]
MNKYISKQPYFFTMAGLPRAGKSTFFQERIKDKTFPEDGFIMSPDLTMESINEYQIDKKQNPITAFEKWEIPARRIAFNLLDNALQKKQNIIQDMGCALPESFVKINSIRYEHKYKVIMYWIHTDTEIVIQRIENDRSRQFFPKEEILKREAALKEFFIDYFSLSHEFYLYNNSKDRNIYELVGKKQSNKFHLITPQSLPSFMRKQLEDRNLLVTPLQSFNTLFDQDSNLL